MADNLVAKIFKEHMVGGSLEPGEEVALRIDQTLLQDATGTMACLQFERMGVDRVRVPFAVQYVDHNIIQLDHKNPDDHRFLQAFAAKYGIHFSRPGNGICHYLHVERFARPGATLIGADSHTTSSGALGSIAIGAGGLDVALVMAGQPFQTPAPKVVGVELTGRLSDWVTPKDVILELLRRRGVRGGLNRIFEFYGEGVKTIDVTGRTTICNMIAELGATTGIFPSDERTREWLEAQQRPDDFVELAADEGASYDEHEHIALDELEPLIARPHSPGNVVKVEEVAGTKVAQVCIGSSVNSGFDDLAVAAAVLRGKVVHPDLVMTVTPGSRQILDSIARTGVYSDLVLAGARMLEPVCGPCVGMGQAPPSDSVSVRTFNRNFPGRSGTMNDQVYLTTPTVAAATALRGVITDPRELGEYPELPEAPANPEVDDRQILAPAPPEEAAGIEIPRGPNIKPPPEAPELPDSLACTVTIVVEDDISTGDLAPDGVEVMAYRSNIPEIAKYTFRRFDPDYHEKAQRMAPGFIVGGHNYGQGSSREHAALAPLHLGIRAVIAKSFARIHRRNLISQGILPLRFKDEDDYERFEQGQKWELPEIRERLERGEEEVPLRSEGGEEITLLAEFSPREREILLAGGVLRMLRREGGGQPEGAERVSGEAER
ncbi:3-isopropylmalate dehydratase large subunit [Rubrobacter xylanophilus DSM 9941]|uniref:aconitate hydratase n=1 Tax=Rubrobacter xylanophilus TaxID=49319 RepID=UPI001C64347A|nr:aconitate hydratase [Rubrobacter xylanophilus]QYJ15849.1 3-isopropylmalate dehydratase large subunit [Rubrobacter xylanophilus DSM 9941]